MLLLATGACSQPGKKVQKNQPLASEVHELHLETVALRSETEALDTAARIHEGRDSHAQISARAAERAALAHAAETTLNRLEAQAPCSRGFLADLLSVADGPALHRFQNLLWNAALGIVFVVGAYRTLTLPEFDATLMVLLGISQGLYLGLKLPEPPKPPAGTPPAAGLRLKRVLAR